MPTRQASNTIGQYKFRLMTELNAAWVIQTLYSDDKFKVHAGKKALYTDMYIFLANLKLWIVVALHSRFIAAIPVLLFMIKRLKVQTT